MALQHIANFAAMSWRCMKAGDITRIRNDTQLKTELLIHLPDLLKLSNSHGAAEVKPDFIRIPRTI